VHPRNRLSTQTDLWYWLVIGGISKMSSPKHFLLCWRPPVACPFFLPIQKFENGSWLHPSRLPLGCGWGGQCTAPGHENVVPTEEELQNFCNLGYAEGCVRLPQNRAWDSVRFSARTIFDTGNNSGRCIHVRYICERAHRPAEHGFLEFDAVSSLCLKQHSDNRLQRMAECFLSSYLERRKIRDTAQAVAS
jgi:hypothetical protein